MRHTGEVALVGNDVSNVRSTLKQFNSTVRGSSDESIKELVTHTDSSCSC